LQAQTVFCFTMLFDYLQYCLGNRKDIRRVVAKMDWQQLYEFAKKQALLGFSFEGIQRIGTDFPMEIKQNPIVQDLLLEWMGKAQQIRRRNIKVNEIAAQLCAQLQNDGLRSSVLKGQGNAVMYPNPYSRTPGDIDIWVNGSRRQITDYAKEHFVLSEDIRYYHLETTVQGVPVELHFCPGIMNNPMYNNRLQKWFKRNIDLQCSNLIQLPNGGEIAVPTYCFNAIYQLCHLYHHFFDEGIGLRQMIDYYYVLLGLEQEMYPVIQRELKHLGLWHFAGAVMYVLHEKLGLPKEKTIVSMDEKRGRLLLSEIMNGGNFGRHYTKYGHFTQQGMAKKYFLKIWRNLHFVRYYPAEALSEPLFRTYHFFWRKIVHSTFE